MQAGAGSQFILFVVDEAVFVGRFEDGEAEVTLDRRVRRDSVALPFDVLVDRLDVLRE